MSNTTTNYVESIDEVEAVLREIVSRNLEKKAGESLTEFKSRITDFMVPLISKLEGVRFEIVSDDSRYVEELRQQMLEEHGDSTEDEFVRLIYDDSPIYDTIVAAYERMYPELSEDADWKS